MPLKYPESLALSRYVTGSWSDETDLLKGKSCSWPSEVFEVLLGRETDNGRGCVDGSSCFDVGVNDEQVVRIQQITSVIIDTKQLWVKASGEQVAEQ